MTHSDPQQDATHLTPTFTARLVRIGALTVALLMIVAVIALAVLSILVGTNVGSQWVIRQALAPLQDGTRVIQFQQSQGTLLAGLRFEQVRYRDGERWITAETLQSSWNPMSLLTGEFLVDQFNLDGLVVHWPNTEATAPVEQGSTDPFKNFPDLPVAINIARFNLRNAVIEITESPYHIDSLTMSSALRDRHLSIQALRYADPLLQVSGALEASLHADMPLDATLDWHYSGPLVEGIESASGVLRLGGDLNRLTVAHTLTTPAQIASTGALALNLFNGAPLAEGFALQHAIEPQLLSATAFVDGRQLRIDSAEISTEGSFAAVALAGNARFTVDDAQGSAIAPTLNVHWQTQWQSSMLTIDSLEVSSATGRIALNGDVAWDDNLQVNVHLAVEEQDGEQYQALLPEGLLIGALQGEGDLHLVQANEALEAALRIETLTGELNGYPLTAAGEMRYGPEGLLIDNLRAASGSTTLAVNGAWSEHIDLNWEIDATDIGTLSPLLSGSIDASGTLKGTPEAPQIDLDATGSQLDFAGTRIDRFRANGVYLNDRNRVQILAEGIAFAAQGMPDIDSVEVQAQGTPESHTVSVALRSALGEVDLGASGSLDYEDPMQWTGQLQRGRMLSDLGLWQLQDSASLAVSADAIALATQCWQQSPSALCLEADWASSGAVQAEATLSDYPLSHFNATVPGSQPHPQGALLPQLPPGSRAEGSLNLQFNATGSLTDDPSDLALRFAVNAGEGMLHIDPAEPTADSVAESDREALEEQTFYWRNAQLRGSRIAAQWEASSTLDFYQPNLANSGMSVQGNANAQLTMSPEQALDGQLNLAFDDLSWVEAFLPTLQNTQGQLQGRIEVAGTLETPQFNGNVSLRDASFDVPGLGLGLHDISTQISSNNEQTVFIRGQASSGDGSLQFDSEITSPLTEARSYHIAIQGENFTLASDEEILLKISPDIHVTGTNTRMNVTGSLVLPVVDVQLTELPESAIDVSADTVIVANDPDMPQVHNAAQVNRGILDELSLTAEVAIKLGDAARFRGFGLDAGLTGALEITQRATGSPLSYGELSIVEGYYETYGRRLDIEHGKLLFFGSLDNPALDIRAVRQTEDVKAGVQMNGTLRNIRSQLFSTPTLPDSDIMAVLITGRPFAEMGNQDSNALAGAITSLGINQGKSFTNQVRTQLGLDTLAINSTGDTSNSSLTLGKYLTPKIFIRYGVGLFETESTLAVDYSVSDRIKLEAKSGSSQSVDIKYTVER